MCPYCHQPVLSSYYFCPNCGTKINEAPLSTSLMTQAWIYAFSVMLPAICYLFITRCPGWKYYKSEDRKTKVIGFNAIVLLVLSSVITFWLAYEWIDNAIQSALSSVNQELNTRLKNSHLKRDCRNMGRYKNTEGFRHFAAEYTGTACSVIVEFAPSVPMETCAATIVSGSRSASTSKTGLSAC
jgi:hypothetical protein